MSFCSWARPSGPYLALLASMSALASFLIFLASEADGLPTMVSAGASTRNLQGGDESVEKRGDEATRASERRDAPLEQLAPLLGGPAVELLVLRVDLQRALEVRAVLLAPDTVCERGGPSADER